MWIGFKDKMWVSHVPFDKKVFSGTTLLNSFDRDYSYDSEKGCGMFGYKQRLNCETTVVIFVFIRYICAK